MIVSKKELNKIIYEELQKELKEKNLNEVNPTIDKLKQALPFTRESPEVKAKMDVLYNTVLTAIKACRSMTVAQYIRAIINDTSAGDSGQALIKSYTEYPSQVSSNAGARVTKQFIDAYSAEYKKVTVGLDFTKLKTAEANMVKEILEKAILPVQDNFVFNLFRGLTVAYYVSLFLTIAERTSDISDNNTQIDAVLRGVLNKASNLDRQNNILYTNLENTSNDYVSRTATLKKAIEIIDKNISSFETEINNLQTLFSQKRQDVIKKLNNAQKYIKQAPQNYLTQKSADDEIRMQNNIIAKLSKEAAALREASEMMPSILKYVNQLKTDLKNSFKTKFSIANTNTSNAGEIFSSIAKPKIEEPKLTFAGKSVTPEILSPETSTGTNKQLGAGSALARESKNKTGELLEENTKKRFKALADIK
jgi:hypothetical protein